MKLRSVPWPFLFAALLAGCASTPAVRDLAGRTGVFVGSLDTGTKEFIEAQNRLNAENQDRLQHLDDAAEGFRTQTRELRFAWTDAGQAGQLSAHDQAIALSPADILAPLQRHSAAPPQIKSSNAEAYGKVSAALAEVATEPKPFAVVRELVQFGAAVHQSFSDLQDEAKKAAQKAADDAAAADKAADASKPAAASH
jgi:hypothetical protein